MDNNTLAIYIHELRNQCLQTQTSFDLFNQAVVNRMAHGVLFGGQLVLQTGSQLSSILWPTRARARGRGDALRKILQLPEKHPLNDRRLSELMEHADEKLEDWIAKTKGEQIVFDFVGDTASFSERNVKDSSVYRAYNPQTRIFHYRGVAYNLQAVGDAIADVGGRVNAVYRQMFPEQAAAEDKARAEAAKAAEEAQKAQSDAEATDTKADAAADAEAKPAAKKTATKKAAAKKTAAKKPAAKKATAKKAATKE